MGPAQAIVANLARPFQFSGRSSRSEFWGFGLIYLAGAFFVFWGVEWLSQGTALLSAKAMCAYLLLFLLPFLAVAWRRLHDIGIFGAPALIPFAILAFGIALSVLEATFYPREYAGMSGVFIAYGGFLFTGICVLILLFLPSRPGPNRYGPNPNEVPQ